MARKFLKLIENTIERYSNGGFLTGDLVKLKSNYKSLDEYKGLNDEIKDYIDSYFDSDKNYYVVNIKTATGTPGPGNNDNRGDAFVAEIAKEMGNGRYDNQGKVALSTNLLDRIDNGVNRHPVPDSDKYDNKVQINPREVGEEDEIAITRMTQQGDTLKRTNDKLASQNTKIPSAPATPSPAVNRESYTSKYMPLNG